MDKLEKLRQERKKLERIESQVLSSRPTDIESLHAWAARELKSVADTMRSASSTETELRTARPMRVTAVTVPPLVLPGKEDMPLPIDPSLPAKTVTIPALELPITEHLSLPSEVSPTNELKDISPLRSEIITPSILPSVPTEIESMEIKSTARHLPAADRPDELSYELSSLSASISVSIEDCSLQDDTASGLRSVSPQPFIVSEEAQQRASAILDQYIAKQEAAERSLREELGSHAKAILQNINRKPDASLLRVGSSGDEENLPPLTTVERRTKKGIAMNVDIARLIN